MSQEQADLRTKLTDAESELETLGTAKASLEEENKVANSNLVLRFKKKTEYASRDFFVCKIILLYSLTKF